MYPIKMYLPARVVEVPGGEAGVTGALVVYRFEAMPDETGFRFFPAGSGETTGRTPAAISSATPFEIRFEAEDGAFAFDISEAGATDFLHSGSRRLSRIEGPFDAFRLGVLGRLVEETRGDFRTHDHRPPEVDGLRCEHYLRKKAACRLEDGEPEPLGLVSWQCPGTMFTPFGSGADVAFRSGGGLYRGTVCPGDPTDPRYTLGEVVDVYCAENRMLHKEVPVGSVAGVFRPLLPRYLDLAEAGPLPAALFPVRNSICDSQDAVLRSWNGVLADESWPKQKYHSGEDVLFRENGSSPLQRGTIAGRAVSRGDWGPRGVYYDIECPVRLTTVARLPESNIYRVLSPAVDGRHARPGLIWNAHAHGGTFIIHPVSRRAVLKSIEAGGWGSYERHGALIEIDEVDFHAYLQGLFEAAYDAREPANVAAARQDGLGSDEEPVFDFYGNNFYCLESAEGLLASMLLLAEGAEDDFCLRFSRLFEAVVDAAMRLDGGKGDFGVMVTGP